MGTIISLIFQYFRFRRRNRWQHLWPIVIFSILLFFLCLRVIFNKQWLLTLRKPRDHICCSCLLFWILYKRLLIWADLKLSEKFSARWYSLLEENWLFKHSHGEHEAFNGDQDYSSQILEKHSQLFGVIERTWLSSCYDFTKS